MKYAHLILIGVVILAALLAGHGHAAPGAGAAADGDGDGLPDSADSCPALAEDPDGVDDLDGCPDTDVSISAAMDDAYTVSIDNVETRTVDISIRNGNYPADILVHALSVSTVGACEVSLVAAPGDGEFPHITDEDGDTIAETYFYLLEWEVTLDAGESFYTTREYEVVCSVPGEHSFEMQVDAVPWPPVEEEDVDDLPNVHKHFPVVTVVDATGFDSDGDGFSDSVEWFTGTMPGVACAATSEQDDEEPDAWPPDWDDNQMADIVDLLPFKTHFGVIDPSDPLYDARFDLNTDAAVDMLDIVVFKPFFGQSCT